MVTSVGSTASTIDPAAFASQLVAADRAAPDARFARVESSIKAQVSAIGSLRSAFSNLQSALKVLSAGPSTQPRAVTLSDSAGFSATASPGAAVGQYQVEVLALASAQKLSSAGYAGADTAVGTGQLAITAGDTAFTLDITAANNTLAGIRDAINAQAGGKGLAASIVTGDDGAHLVLTALGSGTANAITVTASGGDGGLSALAYDPQGASNMTQLAAATNAQLKVDGILRTSDRNTVTDLVPGVSFTLKQAAPGTLVQMTVDNDAAAQLAAVKSFVTAYNGGLYAIASTTNYNPATKVAAALNGDAMVRGVSRQMRDAMGADVTALKALGIGIGKDGTLTLNDAEFSAGAARDPAAIGRLFGTGADSLGGRLKGTMDTLLTSGGPLDSRSEGLTSRSRSLTTQRDALDRRMVQAEARYRAQFTALDMLMTRLQSTSDFLTQQLSPRSES